MSSSPKLWTLALSPISFVCLALLFADNSMLPKIDAPVAQASSMNSTWVNSWIHTQDSEQKSLYSYQEASIISAQPVSDFRASFNLTNRNSQSPQSTRYQIEFSTNNNNEWLIRINQQPVFIVNSLAEAAIATTKLSLIFNAPDFNPALLVGKEIGDEYIGKYKDVNLFTISRSDTVNPSLQLTQWMNNLRVATGAEPLTLVEAQTQMHQLVETGQQIEAIASWYGPYFQGRQTASGEYFEQKDFTAAHPSLPFDTYLRVTNQHNGKSVIVRINDRGPYFGNRSLDLSHAAAIALNSDEAGVVPVTAEILAPS
jgi:rare lipoprotein A